MGKREIGKFKKPPDRRLLKAGIALIVVALVLALAWWGISVDTGTGTSRVATRPQGPMPESTPPAPEPPREEEASVSAEQLTVHFRHRSYYLHKAQMADIRKFLAGLGAYDGLEFHIDAYTSSRGTKSYNQRLSERRARAVRNYIRSKGVPGSAITIAAHGESDPVASNRTAVGRRQNRRAIISVTGRR